MRFGPFLLITLFIAVPAFARPGDKINADSAWTQHPSKKRQIGLNDTPIAPEGFSVQQIASNLGKIAAITSVGSDLFVADSAKNRVLRLQSRTTKNTYDARAEYLIGFNQIQDLDSNSEQIFMSDANGVWAILVGRTLVATQAPRLLFANPHRNDGGRISIAMHPTDNLLYVGTNNCVFSINPENRKKTELACGNWIIQDIAVSPGGGVWASVIEQDKAFILPVRSGDQEQARLELPATTHVNNLLFWDKETYPKEWPAEWASDLIISLEGGRPMLARAHFNYGDIDTSFTSFIDGFSMPSRIVGRREYWGIPAAIDILENGQLVFIEQERGALWLLEKDPIVEKTADPKTQPVNLPEPESIPENKSDSPKLLRGSSITSASSLETDELLRPSTQPDQTTKDKKN